MRPVLTQFLELMIAYSALMWLVGHQGTCIVAAQNGDVKVHPFLVVLMKITSSVPIYIGALIWIGYRTHWYEALIVFAASFLITPFLLIPLGRLLGFERNPWSLCGGGIVIIPLLVAELVHLVGVPAAW